MNWKMALAVGAVVGGVVYAARRRGQRSVTPKSPWAEVTDPVTRFGGQ